MIHLVAAPESAACSGSSASTAGSLQQQNSSALEFEDEIELTKLN